MKGTSIEERACTLAKYIIETKDTVRGAARKFGISKSTVHMDVDTLQLLGIPQFVVLSRGFAHCGETRARIAVKI